MYYGNQQFLFVYEQFDDVRLVAAPPSSIGKFGGDTDNWIWPRHTGDFSVFRIYASKENKPAAYAKVADLFREAEGDVMVLARYMQILSPELCENYPGQIINIHHSFLPSFVGAKPYHQAYAKGVKLIGATCHYVTADLDQGPIIEQDVIRIDHSDAVEDMVRYGKDIEKTVLARGLRYHLEDRVLVHGNKTVVFR